VISLLGFKDLMQTAQNLQSKVAELQAEMATRTVTGSSGGGMVVVEANGAQEIISVKIEKDIVDPEEIELLEDLVTAAVNDALKKSRDMVAQEMSKVTHGMKIPGLT
jgi:DNA-binding YbaB/EbfC family protein